MSCRDRRASYSKQTVRNRRLSRRALFVEQLETRLLLAGNPLFRVNAGGPQVTGTPVWEADTAASPSIYNNAGSGGNSAVASTVATINMSDASIPADTPMALFQSERFDKPGGQNLLWDFPVAAGDYEVRLYFAETWSGAFATGVRVFDVQIEGVTVLDDYDIYADADSLTGSGSLTGFVKSFIVTSDANLDIDFLRVIQNPSIKGIEILDLGGEPVNQPPTVNAGVDQAITLPTNSVNLDATVTDDNFPSNPLTTTWSVFSGPGTGTFGDATSVDTTATFSQAGTYVLRLTADDGQFVVSDDVQIVVNSEQTQAAVVSFTLMNADTDLPLGLLTNGQSINLADLPTQNLNVRADTVQAVGSVRFDLDGQVNFRTETASPYALFGDSGGNYNAGSFTLGGHTLIATPFSGGGGSGTPGTALGISFTVINQGEPVNQPPTANAGVDQTITLPTSSVSLDATVTDDNFPSNPLTTTWTMFSGPSAVTFGNAANVDTTASFSQAGTYILRLTANDGQFVVSDDVQVVVNSQPTSGPAVTSFTLINADTDQPLGLLTSGQTINLADLPTQNLNVRADTTQEVDSVQFDLDGQVNFRTETDGPYALFGDSNGDYSAGSFSLGGHTLTATPSSSGTPGTALSVNFTVIDESDPGGLPISFGRSTLANAPLGNPTKLQFGPDGRLYVAQQNGLIRIFDVVRNGPNDYQVVSSQQLTIIQNIPNHDDDGALNPSVTKRQVTGMLVTGTAQNPVMYVSSSDPRIGEGNPRPDTNLDTNSGIVSRLTWNGSSWVKLDLVRGLPRSEGNHSVNGLDLDEATNTLYLAVGSHTNMGAPANGFAFLPEYALSAAILSIDLDAIGETTYDLPTLDDEDRPGVNDANDPFGGNDGKNQAIIDPNGPVQVYASGFRNPYDVLLTTQGRLYAFDNGPNAGWGDVPIGEGPEGNATNAPNEPGMSLVDQLHHITGPGFYGGHPNPTRSNPNNTFNTTNPQSPVALVGGNPIESDYLLPGVEDGALYTVFDSTNGLDEYTANTFGGQMQGDLIVASFDNTIKRVKLNAAGDAVILSETLFSNIGVRPLDVDVVDSGPFAGTIWVADIGFSEITVFEPSSGVSGDPNDLDGDGYSNDDEIANGTNPNSAADVPPDWDMDFVSNLNDPNDDNDSLLDNEDPFAIDPTNGQDTPVGTLYTWDNDVPSPGKLLGLGFTGLMTNGAADYESLFDPHALTAGGAAGIFTVDSATVGTTLGAANTQEQAFQFGANVSGETEPFVATTSVVSPFGGLTPQAGQEMGLYIGTGDQDNYVKFVLSGDSGGSIKVTREIDGAFATFASSTLVLPDPDFVELHLVVDPVTSEVQAQYSIDGALFVDLGDAIPIPSAWLSSTLAVGVISTNLSGSPLPVTWEFLGLVHEESSAGGTIYRVNVGGPQQLTNPVWEADTAGSPSPYNNASTGNSSANTTTATIAFSPSVPAGTPMAIFQTNRADAAGGSELEWNFPVAPGEYDVRLYFVEAWSGAFSVGTRKFDVAIEGAIVLDEYDVFAEAGALTGIVETIHVTNTDGNLDIDFLHVTRAPIVSGIEILASGSGSEPANQSPSVNGGIDQAVTLPATSVNLNATVMDDNFPANPLTTTWSLFSGPGAVTFGDAARIDTTATFSQAGTYVLRLTANDGQFVVTDDVQITVNAGPAGQGIIDFTLIDAVTDQPMFTISDGMTIDLAQLATTQVNIRANTTGAVGSVVFHYDTSSNFNTDGSAPYSTFGDTGGDYVPVIPSLGNHILTAQAYTGPSGTGSLINTLTLDFQIVVMQGIPDQIHLSWTDDPTTTQTVVWRTFDLATPSTVEYRQLGEVDWQSTTGGLKASGTTGTLHEATITGLVPATQYEYRVLGDDGISSNVYVLRTAPAPGTGDVDFAYFADTGIVGQLDGLTSGTQQITTDIANLNPLLLLGGGDYAYYSSDMRFGPLDAHIDAWFNQAAPYLTQSVLMPTFGNHEVRLQESYDSWIDRMSLPESQTDNFSIYSFDVGQVHFVSILAVYGAAPLPTAQVEWIISDIQDALARGQQWIIPYMHMSSFADGANQPSNVQLRNQLGPVFEQLGVQLVLSAHDQNYERTFPLVNVGNGSPIVTDSQLTGYDQNDGVIWLKVGPGGRSSNTPGEFSEFQTNPPPYWTAARDDTMYHFARFTVSTDGILTTEIYATPGDGTPSFVFDSFTISLNSSSALTTSVNDQGDSLDDHSYEVWKQTHGSTGLGLPGDANGDGIVSAADFTILRDQSRRSHPPAEQVRAAGVPGTTQVEVATLLATENRNTAVEIPDDSTTPVTGSLLIKVDDEKRDPMTGAWDVAFELYENEFMYDWSVEFKVI